MQVWVFVKVLVLLLESPLFVELPEKVQVVVKEVKEVEKFLGLLWC